MYKNTSFRSCLLIIVLRGTTPQVDGHAMSRIFIIIEVNVYLQWDNIAMISHAPPMPRQRGYYTDSYNLRSDSEPNTVREWSWHSTALLTSFSCVSTTPL